MDVCYNVQTAVDSKNKLIVEFEVTKKTEDNNQISVMSADHRHQVTIAEDSFSKTYDDKRLFVRQVRIKAD